MDSVWQDVKYALRTLLKTPAFTSATILMLALGIGANAAIFTIFQAVLLKRLPYADPDKLVQVWETRRSGDFLEMEASYPDFVDLEKNNQVFSDLAGYSGTTATLAGTAGAEKLYTPVASANFFSVLGVHPLLGHSFSPEADLANSGRTVILSYGGWQRRFAGDPNVLGRTVTLDGEPNTIIGVLPSDFQFAPARSADFWQGLHVEGWRLRRSAHWIHPVGRLKPGVTLQAAQANLAAMSRQLEQQYPTENAGVGTRVIMLRDQMVGQVRPVLLMIMAGVGFVLLITSANVAGLLIARSAHRRREIAIRTALGASTGRIIRQLLTESGLLALAGGMTGMLAAAWTVPLIVAAIPKDQRLMMPSLAGATIDRTVLLFTFGATVLAGLLFGLTAALQAFRPQLIQGLQESNRVAGDNRHRLREGLVVGQVMVAILLLVGAGLLLKSLVRFMNVDPGFNTHGLLTMELSLPDKRYPDQDRLSAFHRSLLEQVRNLHGVKGAASVNILPLSGGGNTSRFELKDHPRSSGGEEYEANSRSISPDYFSVMGVPLRTGRVFTPNDNAKSPHVVVVNQVLADQVFRGQDPIGKWINFTYSEKPDLWQIVGIVGDENVSSLDVLPHPVVYTTFDQDSDTRFSLAIRTDADPLQLASTVRRLVAAMDLQVAVSNIASMDELVAESPSMFLRSFPAYLIAAFALLALLLACIGLYGLLAYSVTSRTREFGIRMAIGARKTDLLRLVLGGGLRLIVLGTLLGIIASLFGAHLMSSFLFGIKPLDLTTFAFVPVLLIGVAMLASYIPARRAAKVDPMVALRYE